MMYSLIVMTVKIKSNNVKKSIHSQREHAMSSSDEESQSKYGTSNIIISVSCGTKHYIFLLCIIMFNLALIINPYPAETEVD